ncbi:MAG: hypothetical protein IJ717_05305 [Treponema sp.]|nr:hypothetical protein [Treponema sp.]
MAASLIGNTYKDMRSGRDENDFWKFESATIVYWGTTKYKYEITDTVFTIKSSVNGQKLYDLDYTLSEDGTTLTNRFSDFWYLHETVAWSSAAENKKSGIVKVMPDFFYSIALRQLFTTIPTTPTIMPIMSLSANPSFWEGLLGLGLRVPELLSLGVLDSCTRLLLQLLHKLANSETLAWHSGQYSLSGSASL